MSAIGPELTSRDVRDVVDIGRKADMTRTSPEDDFDPRRKSTTPICCGRQQLSLNDVVGCSRQRAWAWNFESFLARADQVTE
jgi:hypothetical protein